MQMRLLYIGYVGFVMSTETAITRNRFSDNALEYDDEFLRRLSPQRNNIRHGEHWAVIRLDALRYWYGCQWSGLDVEWWVPIPAAIQTSSRLNFPISRKWRRQADAVCAKCVAHLPHLILKDMLVGQTAAV